MSRMPNKVYEYNSDNKDWDLIEEKDNTKKPLKDIKKQKLNKYLLMKDFSTYVKMIKKGKSSKEIQEFILSHIKQ